MIDIPKDTSERKKLVDLAHRRALWSANYFDADFQEWLLMNKIYHKIRDAVYDPDEPDIALSYAFAIVEDAVSKITEPILQRKPPIRTQPKHQKHARQAEIMSAFQRQYYGRPEYQIEITEANKELVITGNSWEFDEYAFRYASGRRWQKVQKQGSMDQAQGMNGQNMPMQVPYQYESLEEVEAQYPVRVGFHSYFPSNFDVFPEPEVKRVRDMHWILRQEKSVALDDLREQYYTDPATQERAPLYDLTELDQFYGPNRKPGSITPIQSVNTFMSKDYAEELKAALKGSQAQQQDTTADMDRVHLLHVMERNAHYVIANGIFVISRVVKPYHLPWIPARLRVYTPIKDKLNGYGILKPIEDEIHQLDDIHTLAMMQWVRAVNKMVAYDPKKIVSVDDFKPRAGGKVRVTNTENVASAVFPMETQDISNSMLSMESNTKGLIERTTAIADFSPGTEGTKQTHKTLGGLVEIQNSLAVRFSTVTRLLLAALQDQAFNMEVMLSQFQFDKVQLPFYGPNGEINQIEANRDDIDTNGVGFDYLIEDDPSFGDDSVARNQVMVMAHEATLYTDKQMGWLQAGMNPKYLPDVDYSVIMGKMAQSFKYPENSLIKPHQNIIQPDQEFQLIMQGQPVQPNPNGDLLRGFAFHLAKLKSPDYQMLLEKGKVTPEANLAYRSFVDASGLMIGRILQSIQKPQNGQMEALNAQDQ